VLYLPLCGNTQPNTPILTETPSTPHHQADGEDIPLWIQAMIILALIITFIIIAAGFSAEQRILDQQRAIRGCEQLHPQDKSAFNTCLAAQNISLPTEMPPTLPTLIAPRRHEQ
jgi:hypothetical protein